MSTNHTYVPFRRFTPKGKRREITKPEHTAFMKAVDTIMGEYGPLDDRSNGGWNVETDYGVLRVHRGLDDLYGYAYSINTAFENAAQFKGDGDHFGYGHRELNTYSGKWNILMFEGDDAIEELKERLAMVGAKKTVTGVIPA